MTMHKGPVARVLVSFGSVVDVIERKEDAYLIGVEDYRFLSWVVINSAGITSDRVASLVGIDVDRPGRHSVPTWPASVLV